MKTKVKNLNNNKPEVESKDQTANSSASQDKEKLLKLVEKHSVDFPKVGELVKGQVINISRNTIYLDLGILGTGIVMGREMKDGLGIAQNLKPGDEVEATVIELENSDGYMELSLREAGYEKTWKELKRKMEENETVPTKILAANRGGLMVEINGITGFLPVSQLSNENYPRVEDGDKAKILELLNRFVDTTMNVRVIDIDKEEEKLIVSEKATRAETEEQEVQRFEIGDQVEGIISGIVKFGAFVKFPPKGKTLKQTDSKELLEGLVHISELAWQLIENPHDIVKIGEKVQCKIIEINRNKISLSIRALKQDPWSQVKEKYQVGDVVEGIITKLNPFGAFVQLDENIHGLAHISELNRFAAGRNLEEIMKVNDKFKFKILSIEPKSHRMGLSPFTDKKKNNSESLAKKTQKVKTKPSQTQTAKKSTKSPSAKQKDLKNQTKAEVSTAKKESPAKKTAKKSTSVKKSAPKKTKAAKSKK
ncbi:MAG: S1 RNA-binding domain-containing protein [Candidatus Moranbacteria bacterium]|nr:S1 RNA-binding domain-containing protein [Candidatus Moranbacteria bacterium]